MRTDARGRHLWLSDRLVRIWPPVPPAKRPTIDPSPMTARNFKHIVEFLRGAKVAKIFLSLGELDFKLRGSMSIAGEMESDRHYN